MALSAPTNFHAIVPNKRATQLPFSVPSKSQSSVSFSLHKPTTIFNENRRRRLFNISASAISRTPGVESSVVDENSKIEKALDRVEVFDLNGTAIPISDLWKDKKAVVAFARHFGCVLCRKRADLLASKKEQMDAAGVALVLIGPGSVDQKSMLILVIHHMGHLNLCRAYLPHLLPRQQGGIIVAGPGKSNISYIHKDKEAGDDPPIEDVLKACCA